MISTRPGLFARQGAGRSGAVRAWQRARGAYNKSNYMWESFYERAEKEETENRRETATTARLVSFLRDTREGTACAEILQIKKRKADKLVGRGGGEGK